MPNTSVPPRARGSCALAEVKEMNDAMIAKTRRRHVDSMIQSLVHAEAFDGGLVDLDAETLALGQRDSAIAQRDRLLHDVLGKIHVRQAHTPVDVRHRAGELYGRG